LAQLVAHPTCNRKVAGSSPAAGSSPYAESVPESRPSGSFPIIGLLAAGAAGLVWLLVGGLVATGLPSPEPQVADSSTEPSTPSVVFDPLARQPFSHVPSQRVRTCEMFSPLFDQDQFVLRGEVLMRGESDVLWAVGEGDWVAPASVQKLFTAAAAWRVLGPDHRLVTSVWANSTGEAWLVGGGDPTITRSPGNNYYGAQHTLTELAQKTVSGIGEKGLPPIQVLHLDSSRYDAFEQWDESWRKGSWSLGYVAPVTAVQVDGDRDNPALRLGKRSTDPESRAHGWFVDAVNSSQPAATVARGIRSVPVDTIEVARVESAPVRELVSIMLRDSDNTLAEVLAREVALAQGTTDFTEAIREGVGWAAEDWPDMYFRDGSGLSPLNQLSARAITTLLSDIATDSELSALRDALPVSAETGSLQRRFQTAGSLAAGAASAKTGSIEGVRSLAGYLNASDGAELTFSLNLSGAGVSDAERSEIDQLVEGLYLCGENLAHWGLQADSTSE
jgi:D-alanyl-D-alanine carboxypeptidase/D-alanyl-D-alanine-endopeptidase (penicillin-binding protein 4)